MMKDPESPAFVTARHSSSRSIGAGILVLVGPAILKHEDLLQRG